MSGHIAVTSTPGVGSIFRLVLPLEPVASHRVTRPKSSLGDLGLRIMLVEDNMVNQLVARQYLKALGCSVHAVQNGQQALEQLDLSCIDVVLMDMQMPVMDGLEATRQIRKNLSTDIPVIGFTASVTANDRALCVASGMNEVISKPLVLTDLKTVLQRYSRRVGPMAAPHQGSPSAWSRPTTTSA